MSAVKKCGSEQQAMDIAVELLRAVQSKYSKAKINSLDPLTDEDGCETEWCTLEILIPNEATPDFDTGELKKLVSDMDTVWVYMSTTDVYVRFEYCVESDKEEEVIYYDI